MENKTDDTYEDEILLAAKREQQEVSLAQLRSGECTQESMLFIFEELVKSSTIRRCTDEF